MARLPAAQKRALEAAWSHMKNTGARDNGPRLDDMLKRLKREKSQDEAKAELVHAAYMRKAPAWEDSAPVAEAKLFGACYVGDLDRQTMQDGALVHDRDLDDPAPHLHAAAAAEDDSDDAMPEGFELL